MNRKAIAGLLLISGCAKPSQPIALMAETSDPASATERKRLIMTALVDAHRNLDHEAAAAFASEGPTLAPRARARSEATLQCLLQKLDVISFNLANADTIGFKRIRANVELIDQPPTEWTPASDRAESHGDIAAAVLRKVHVFDQGVPLPGDNLALMIQGEGFFQLELPNGSIGYTRAGNFIRSARGTLVQSGTEYCLKDSPIIPDDCETSSVSISNDGEISVSRNGEIIAVGQILLARFRNPSALAIFPNNFFVPTSESGEPIEATPGNTGVGTLMSDALETSNVDVFFELMELRKTRQQCDAELAAHRLIVQG